MSFKIILLPEARLDIKDSIDWYNEQKAGLGKIFYQAVKSTILLTLRRIRYTIRSVIGI